MNAMFLREVHCPSWPGPLARLANNTMKEPWKFKKPVETATNPDTYLLEQYLFTVFRLLVTDYESAPTDNDADTAICVRSNYACFNMGLLSNRMSPIYCYLEKNRISGLEQPHVLRGFCDEGSSLLRNVEKLPQKPFAFLSPEQLSFFPRWPIRFDHQLLLDNAKSRGAVSSSLVDRPDFTFMLRVATEIAVEKASQIPGLVVPHVMSGQLKFLVPISFGDPNDLEHADFAMNIDIMNGYYMASCFFDTRQAYARTRIFGRPVAPWLTALVE